MRHHPFIRLLAAGAVAVAVTGCILAMLASMNDRPVPDRSQSPPVRTILLSSNLAPPPERQQAKDEPAPPEPEPMVVDLDMPAPEFAEIEPLDLRTALPAPTIESIEVHVPVRAVPALAPAKPAPTPPAPAPAKSAATPGGPLQADRVDHPPRERAGNTHPNYPTRERRMGIEGEVVVKILIDESGRVLDAQILSGREGFAAAVLGVVRQWRFTPANHEGRAVQVWGIKTVRFKLTD